ncbi:MAG TPA: sugar ABC transporter permease [Solirubrobacter sp.]|nr:sugar ABC transporter permease [Solirubrobacter sp.]
MTTTIPASTAAPTAAAPAEPAHDRRSERLLVWLFLVPTVGGLALFTLLPIAASFVLAFFRWDIITSPEWAGLHNFGDIASDVTVRRAFLNTIGFVIVAVALQLGIALWLAILVQSRLPSWLQSVFRSAFFFPLVLSAASVSLVMAYLFNADFGLVNSILNAVGIPDVQWLSTGSGAVAVVIFVYVWQSFGFSLLLFLGGLASIPTEVYEAAELDGAKGWSRFTKITLPLISPTLLVATVMAVIAALQIFDQPWVLTRGGPGDSTRTAVMMIYQSGFQELQFGRASAIGLVLTALILAATAAQFRLSRRYVFYQ